MKPPSSWRANTDHDKGVEEPTIIVMQKAFSWPYLSALAATGNAKVQAGFGPYSMAFIRVPYMDSTAIEAIVNPMSLPYCLSLYRAKAVWPQLQPITYWLCVRFCDEHQLLMMLDEVQTGNGRTGRYFCYQNFDFLPDVVTTAKGLGNGVPMAPACRVA